MSPVVQETGRAVSCYGERLLKSYFPPIRQQTTSWETCSIVPGVYAVLRSSFLNSSLKRCNIICMFRFNLFRLNTCRILWQSESVTATVTFQQIYSICVCFKAYLMLFSHLSCLGLNPMYLFCLCHRR